MEEVILGFYDTMQWIYQDFLKQ